MPSQQVLRYRQVLLATQERRVPSVEHLKSVRDEVEEATNARSAEALAAALSADEADELARIATAMQARVS